MVGVEESADEKEGEREEGKKGWEGAWDKEKENGGGWRGGCTVGREKDGGREKMRERCKEKEG